MGRVWTGGAFARDLEEDAACGTALVVSAVGLVALSAAALIVPRGLVLPVLIVGCAGISAAAGGALARRTATPRELLAAFSIAPGAAMALLVMIGVAGMGLLWLALLAAAACGVAVAVRRARRRDERGEGDGLRCSVCGYDLRGMEDIVGLVGCPECGFGRGRSGESEPLPRHAEVRRVWRMAAPGRAGDGEIARRGTLR